MTYESQSFDDFSPLIEYSRVVNGAGNVTTLSATIGGTADFQNTYTYDNLARLQTSKQQSVTGGNAVAQKRADFTYDNSGLFTQITRYADVAASERVINSFYSYDGIGRLAKLIHSTDTTVPTSGWGSGALTGYQFTYDAASRVSSLDSYADGVTNYTLDNTDQLTAADHTGQTDESYSYDVNGNRTMSGYSTGSNNRLTSDGTYNYTYDDEGNRLSKTKIATGEKEKYTWDWRNRLTKITFKDSGGNVTKTVDQTYDVFNQWIRRSVDNDGPGSGTAVDTFFSYENGQVNLQFDGSTAGSLTHRYLWNPAAVDQLLADETVTSLSSAGSVLWPLADHLGTIRDLGSHNSGTHVTTIENHRRYDDYGDLVSETNSAVDEIFDFTGRLFDEATGLQNNLNRWYNPSTGRWMREDPIGFEGGDANLSRYVGNNPVSRTDPTGLVWRGGVLGSAGLGALTGAMTVGRCLTYPLRWCGRDYSAQDAALEKFWEEILNTNDTTTRPITEGAAITASVCTYGAIGAQGATNLAILNRLAELRARAAILQQTIRALNAQGFSAPIHAARLAQIERESLRLESLLP